MARLAGVLRQLLISVSSSSSYIILEPPKSGTAPITVGSRAQNIQLALFTALALAPPSYCSASAHIVASELRLLVADGLAIRHTLPAVAACHAEIALKENSGVILLFGYPCAAGDV